MGHFWNLSNYKEALIQFLKVNSLKTKNSQLHVVHKNALEWSTRGQPWLYRPLICDFHNVIFVYLDEFK